MDVATWLKTLGLERYAEAFAANDIDMALLPTLTAEDLQGAGVASVGHRRRLLHAIAALPRPPSASPRSVPERRRLTVMLVDLVGSTLLSRQLDPEQLQDVMRAYQGVVAGEIARFDGYLAKFMGDGVLAYFGWPHAHEDAAERAVRAGLAIAAAVTRVALPSGESLAARIGIATGAVVVGELIGDGTATEQLVVGETPNLAARLQTLARPGQVVMAEATRQLVGGTFELEQIEARPLRGFDGPVSAWRVRGPALVEGRFEARHGAALQAMIGREPELARLLAAWADAKAGRGRVVVLCGEAGIGKSRLARALLDATDGEPHNRVRLHGSPHYTNSALWPAAEELGLAAVLETAASLGSKLDALDHALGSGTSTPFLDRSAAPAGDGGGVPPTLAPEGRRERTLQALTARLLGLAEAQPLLVLVEDAHWIDPTTIELLTRVVDSLAAERVLLVVTTRPEGEGLLPPRPHVERLLLRRLARSDVAGMVASLIGQMDVPEPLLATVLARTDGVPLFIEELVETLLVEGRALAGPLPDTAVPASLHDMLMARLDRLPEAKEVAQLAACIGREFDAAVLQRIAELPAVIIEAALEQLTAAEILLRRGDAAGTYVFKHALLCDAAYESLLRSRRRTVHAALVRVLEAGSGVPPERIAHHAAAAEQWGKAMQLWSVTGKAALDRAAHLEAIGLLGKALQAGSRLGLGVDVAVTMIELRRSLSWAAGAVGDLPVMLKSLSDAEASAARFGLGRLKCELRTQRAHCESIFGGSVVQAIRNGRVALQLAKISGRRELLAAARFALGQAHWLTGEYRLAIDELGADAADYMAGLRVSRVASGGTLAVDGLAILGGCLGLAGRTDEALHYGRAAEAVAAETGQPVDAVTAAYHLARTHLVAGDVEAARPLIERGLGLARRCGLRALLPWQLALDGHARTLAGQPRQGLAALDEAVAGCTAVRLQYVRVAALLHHGRASLALGLNDPAAAADEALALAQACHYRALQVDAHRLQAEVAMARGDAAAASAHLSPARAIALELGLAPELAAMDRLAGAAAA